MNHCRTCGSAIVATINDSNFGDGECGACEYRRYRTQPDLIEALDILLDETLDNDVAFDNALSDRQEDAYTKALAALKNAGQPSPVLVTREEHDA